jgi:DNA replication protein DnaC
MISIKHNKKPKLNLPKFSVDNELHKDLNKFEIQKLMNKSNFSLFLGKPGSGKTSLMTGLLGTPVKKGGFKKVFETIIVFMPASSRSSMKDGFFDKYLPEEQIFDNLTLENLNEAYEIAKENATEGYRTLMIFDDVQKGIKGECEKLFLEICNNRRHRRINLFLCCQNYFSIPKQVRSGLTDLFIFKASKKELEQIFEEQIETHKDKFLEVLEHCYKEPHDFLYINPNTQRLFSNWNEIVIHEI